MPTRFWTEIAGFDWEVELAGDVVVLRRSDLASDTERDLGAALHTVAIGHWSGERIEIRKWMPVRGEPLDAAFALPMLSMGLHIATQP